MRNVATFLISVTVGLGAGGLLVGVPIQVRLGQLEAAKKREWALSWVQVAVARRALSQGQTLTPELIDVRPAIGKFVTASMVRPDDITRLIGTRLTIPVDEGQPLRWVGERSLADAAHRDEACGIAGLSLP